MHFTNWTSSKFTKLTDVTINKKEEKIKIWPTYICVITILVFKIIAWWSETYLYWLFGLPYHNTGDNGTIHLWDWKTGYNFQRTQAPAQPGSIDSESGIFAMKFDNSGSRLLTAEADKTIKIYKEDDEAVSKSVTISLVPSTLCVLTHPPHGGSPRINGGSQVVGHERRQMLINPFPIELYLITSLHVIKSF